MATRWSPSPALHAVGQSLHQRFICLFLLSFLHHLFFSSSSSVSSSASSAPPPSALTLPLTASFRTTCLFNHLWQTDWFVVFHMTRADWSWCDDVYGQRWWLIDLILILFLIFQIPDEFDRGECEHPDISFLFMQNFTDLCARVGLLFISIKVSTALTLSLQVASRAWSYGSFWQVRVWFSILIFLFISVSCLKSETCCCQETDF